MSKSDARSVVPIEPLERDDETYRTYHDMETDGLTLTISTAVAEISGKSELDLIPDFSKYVDPDALNRLFRTQPNGESRQPGHLTLHIDDYEVTVHSSGEILIQEL